MKKEEKKAIICLILEALKKQGSWCGETHVQKAAYLAKEMFQIPLNEYDFTLYRYGPYSSEVSDDLVVMRNEGIIVVTATPPFGATYSVEENNEITNEIKKHRGKYDEKINFIAEKFGDKGVGYLEILCTAHWVIKNHLKEDSKEKLANILSKIKVKIMKEDAQETIKEVNGMIKDAKYRFSSVSHA